jgi:membrane protein implicated in regulation of membrane protease activity
VPFTGKDDNDGIIFDSYGHFPRTSGQTMRESLVNGAVCGYVFSHEPTIGRFRRRDFSIRGRRSAGAVGAVMKLFAWYNLIFYIPLAAGVLLILGVALGVELPHGVDVDAHPDMDADGGADGHGADGDQQSHDGHASGQGLLALLGFGKAPVLVLIMAMALIFGGTGTIANLFLASLLQTSGVFVFISIAAASMAMVTFTGLIGRVVNRFMPTLETTSVKRKDLVGCTGSLVLAADPKGGLAQISKDGDIYQVSCRSSEPLGRGVPVLVIEYDSDQNVYLVTRNPLS